MILLKNKLIVSVFICMSVSLVSGIVYAEPDLNASPDNKKTDVNPETTLKKKTGSFTGKLAVKGGSMAGGKVFFYDALTGPPPDGSRYARVPDIIGAIDLNGRFAVEVPAGTYYILALKRSKGELGLPDKKDLRFFDQEKGKPNQRIIKEGERIDLGVMEVDRLKNPTKKKKSDALKITAIEGVITDTDGKPVANTLVYAFLTSQKQTRPLFASYRSDKNGKYRLRAVKGTYYLRVRSNMGGGPPATGETVDSYGEKEPVAITVADGEIKTGIDLKVESYPGIGPFLGKGPKYGKGPKQDAVTKPTYGGREATKQ